MKIIEHYVQDCPAHGDRSCCPIGHLRHFDYPISGAVVIRRRSCENCHAELAWRWTTIDTIQDDNE